MFELFVFILLILGFIVEKIFVKRFSILDEISEYSYVNSYHKWFIQISVGLVIIMTIIEGIYFPNFNLYLNSGFITIILLIDARIQFKIEREEKQYIRSLVRAGAAFAIFVGALIVCFHTTNFKEVVEDEFEHIDVTSLNEMRIAILQMNPERKVPSKQLSESVIIEDGAVISNVLSEISLLELKRAPLRTENIDVVYEITARGGWSQQLDMEVYENHIRIGHETYRIIGDNTLSPFLEAEDFEWQQVEGNSN